MRSLFLDCDAAGDIDPADWQGYIAAVSQPTRRIVLFAHGWLTDQHGFLELAGGMADGLKSKFGDDTLFVGLHWPSDNLLGVFSYYEVERRARLIGDEAGFDIVQLAFEAGVTEFISCGHSFGAIVAAATLESFSRSSFGFQSTQYIAIQGAIANDVLESGQWCGPIQRMYTRTKVTTSKLDKALDFWFPCAEHAELRQDCNAMGAAGPSDATVKAFGDRMTVVDLTAAQAAHPMDDPFSGEHSNILLPEVFDLIASA